MSGEAVNGLPAEIRTNAWTGQRGADGALDAAADRWGARGGLPSSQAALHVGLPPNPTDWSAEDVGYGVLLAESDASAADKAAGLDAPESVRELLAARPGTVMLRWEPALKKRFVRRYLPDGGTQTPRIGLTKFGTATGRLPRYVVIIGGPDVIPWSVQYELGTRHAVGRLPFGGAALDNYLAAMLDGWAGTDLDVRAPLVWTVSRPGDITAEMRAVVTDPLAVRLTDPQLPRFTHVTDADATGATLLDRLRTGRPALVVTSSHGSAEGTGAQLAAVLGLPVDALQATVALADLDAAMPAGAIWHAQACCSAGSEGPSKYLGLVGPGTLVASTLAAVAGLGSTVAPAVLRLLGRERPVRAVVGHVEPTFDWTLRDPDTGQGLGQDLVDALSANLHAGQPVGYAYADYRLGVGQLHSDWLGGFDLLAGGDVAQRPRLTRLRLTAFDRQSLVLLGDPTVTLPPLDGAP